MHMIHEDDDTIGSVDDAAISFMALTVHDGIPFGSYNEEL
jgi:hypothetical protein